MAGRAAARTELLDAQHPQFAGHSLYRSERANRLHRLARHALFRDADPLERRRQRGSGTARGAGLRDRRQAGRQGFAPLFQAMICGLRAEVPIERSVRSGV